MMHAICAVKWKLSLFKLYRFVSFRCISTKLGGIVYILLFNIRVKTFIQKFADIAEISTKIAGGNFWLAL